MCFFLFITLKIIPTDEILLFLVAVWVMSNEIKQSAKELAKYIICSQPMSSEPPLLFIRMIRKSYTTYKCLFHQSVNMLDRQHLATSLNEVYDKMFRDGGYNWGRIATLYAFGKVAAEHGDPERLSQVTGDFVANHLSEWITSQGGWPTDSPKNIWENLCLWIFRAIAKHVLGVVELIPM